VKHRLQAQPDSDAKDATVHPLGSASLPAPREDAPAVLRLVAPASLGVATRPCGCGHGRDAHEHYRRGTDCALCSCSRYRRPLLSRLRGAGR